MDIQQVVNCTFSLWYSKFKHVSWESEIIPLSDEFVEYLKGDGLVLPDDSNCGQETKYSDEDDIDWDDSGCGLQAPQFPEIDAQIKAAIIKFGGVFPKLNWSSAKDASWISLNNTMKCVVPNDVYLLLKSSEFITHDLTQPFKDCDIGDEDSLPEIKYELILRKWVDVNPAMEFRCFVKNNNLIGISQRDVSNLYLLVGREEEILDDIQHFFRNQIRSRFSDDKYVFDVYRQSKRDVVLIDFNPFGRTTDALLFDWDSLLSSTLDDDNEIPEFRCIRESVGVQPNPYRNSVPKDFVDLGSGMDALKLIDLMNLSTNSNGHLNGDSSP